MLLFSHKSKPCCQCRKLHQYFMQVVVMGLSQDTCFLSHAAKNYYSYCFFVFLFSWFLILPINVQDLLGTGALNVNPTGIIVVNRPQGKQEKKSFWGSSFLPSILKGGKSKKSSPGQMSLPWNKQRVTESTEVRDVAEKFIQANCFLPLL